MTHAADWPCWEIMQCNPENAKQCPAYHASSPCWEVMRKLDAYSFNICRDCVVYLIKQNSSTLSQNEIRDILVRKGLQSGEMQCPQFSSAGKESYLGSN